MVGWPQVVPGAGVAFEPPIFKLLQPRDSLEFLTPLPLPVKG